MTDPTVFPIPAAFSPAFVARMGDQMQSLLTICNQSPEFMKLISMLPANSIRLGEAGGGTGNIGHLGIITVDQSWLPGGQNFGSLDDMVEFIAHEMGHDIDSQGSLNEIAQPTLSQARQTGLNNEGVALMYEYIVSQQIGANGIAMHSGGTSLQNTLSALAEFTGFNPHSFAAGVVSDGEFRTKAIDAGGQWTAPRRPSVAPESETYSAYYEEGWLFYNLASTKGTGDSINTHQTVMPYVPVNPQTQQYVLDNVTLLGKSGAQYTATGIFQDNGTPIWEYLSTNNSGTISVLLGGIQPTSGQFAAAVAISNCATVNSAAGTVATITGDGDGIYEVGGSNTVVTLTGSSTDKLYFGSGTAAISGVTTSKPTSSAGGNTLTWSTSFLGFNTGIQYSFTYNTGSTTLGTLTISSSTSSSANEFIIDGFNLQTAEDLQGTGFDGIKLKAPTVIAAGAPSATAPNNPQASVTATGDSQTFTVYGAGGESYKLAATGDGASTDILSYGSGDASLSSGSATVTIPVGQDSVTVTLIDPNAAPQAQTVTLTATAAGDSTPSNSLAITFGATAASVAPTNVITGVYSANTWWYYGSASNNDLINAGAGTNVIQAGSGNDSITSGAGTTEISSTNGNSTISGGGGQDIIKAGDGNNQIYAGSVVTLSAALTQQQTATAGNTAGDFIGVGNGNNTIVGGTGNDLIAVGSGANTIVCGPGAVTLMGGVDTDFPLVSWSVSSMPVGSSGNTSNIIPGVLINGLNVVYGAPGFTAPAGYQGPTAYGEGPTSATGANTPVGLGNDTIYGGTGNSEFLLSNGNNYLDAGGGDDYIFAGVGNNTIFGGAGNDTIDGGGGNNYIDAETGNDFIEADGGSATVFGGTGNDTIYSGDSTANWATSETANSYLDADSGNSQLYGSAGNDTLMGGSGNATLNAGAGNEYLEAESGNTTMIGGAGNDTIIGGSGNDSINAGNGDTTITGGTGTATIVGGAGNDVIAAGDGGTDNATTQVIAGSGNTTITGGAGVDQIQGGSGNDVLSAGNGGDAGKATQVTAGTGNTTITGGLGIDNITGGAGSNALNAGDGGTAANRTSVTGGSGTTTITGGVGYDILKAGSGSDTLIAGSGTSTLVGGAGSATYQINATSGTATINNSVAGDTLTFGTGVTIAGMTVSQSGSATTLASTSGATVTVNGAGLSQATFADGTVATFAQLLSPTFTIGNTTYTSVNGVLAPVTTATQASAARIVALATATGQASTAGHALRDGAQIRQMTASTAAVQTLTLTGSADISGTGNNVNDIINANAGSDTLIAGTADDTLVGGGASDDYVVSAGTGTITTINGSTSADTLSFTAGITLANLTVSTASAANGSLIVTLQNSQGGTVVINSDTSGDILDNISFVDGSSASLGELLAPLTTGPTAATSAGNVTLAGGIQNMILTGTANITATGNAQDDIITANTGNDTLISGTANDTLKGGGGTATYVFNAGDGNLTIANSGSADTLSFGTGITESDLTTASAVVNGVTVVTIADNQGGSVIVQGGSLNEVSFADGSSATLTQLLAPSYTKGTTLYSTVNATAGSGITAIDLTGSAAISATANTQNDTLTANSGNDTLIAGTGNDTLIGGGASDTYVIAAGKQTATIEQSGVSDTLSFGSGVTLADLSATAALDANGNTVVTLQNSLGGTVVIDASANGPLDQIDFANGSSGSLGAILAQATTGITAATSATSVTLAEGIQNMTLTGTANITATGNDYEDVITANSGNDTLIAGTANDTLVGGSGTTTYEVSAGGGNVTIGKSGSSDTLVFGAGITESDLTTTSAVVGGATVVTIADDQGGSVIVQGGSLNEVSFADGSSATLTQLLAPSYTIGATTYSTVSATAGTGITALVMTGSVNVTATGNTLNDTLAANSGNDTLVAGSGNDTLIGGVGATTYVVHTAYNQVTTIEQSGTGDTLSLGGSGVSISATAMTAADGSTTVTIQCSGSGVAGPVVINDYSPGDLDQITLSDGSTQSLSAIIAQASSGITAATSAASVTLAQGIQHLTLTGSGVMATGNNQDDIIFADGSNDTLIAGSANDTLKGGVGTTTYVVNGEGNVTITNSRSADTLVFGAGITESDLSTSTTIASGGITVVTIANSQGGSVTLTENNGVLNNLVFANGDAPTLQQLLTSYTEGTTLYSHGSVVASSTMTGIDLTGSHASATANTLNDTLQANAGNDTLIAGSGNDTLIGGVGATTYIVGAGSGVTTISQSNAADILRFGAGITASNLSLTSTVAANGQTTVTIQGGGGGEIVIEGYGSGMLDNLDFANGSSASLGALLAQATTGSNAMSSAVSVTMPEGFRNLTLTGTANLTATGNDVDDRITANSGNDSLVAGTANDTLVAGAGNDTLTGGVGATTYVFNQQSGDPTTRTITIQDSGSGDTLQFGSGITAANITGTSATVNGTLVVTLQVGTLGTVVIDGGSLSTLSFANGTTASLAALVPISGTTGNTQYAATSATLAGGLTDLTMTGSANVTATGNSLNDVITANIGNDSLVSGGGNDTLVAGSGVDTLVGGSGHTTYDIALGNGNVTIQSDGSADTLVFGPGIQENDLTITSAEVPVVYLEDENIITITDSLGGTVTIDGQITNFSASTGYATGYSGSVLNSVSFANGDSPTLLQMESGDYTEGTSLYFTPNSQSNANVTLPGGITTAYALGSYFADVTANSLNDSIVGNAGQDDLVAGSGSDTLQGGSGNDTLAAGTGNATLIGGSAINTFQVAANSGAIAITKSGALDTLNFGAGIHPFDLSATATTSAAGIVTVTITDSAGNPVVITETGGTVLDKLTFASGETASLSAILAQASTGSTAATSATSLTLPTSIQNMTLTGTANLTATGNSIADVIRANSGNDTLIAGSASDTLIAGSGNDTLTGGSAATTYDFNPQAGDASTRTITITAAGTNDVLQFGNGIAPASVTASSTVVNGTTFLTLSAGQYGRVVVQGGSLNQFAFANGAVLDLNDLLPTSGMVGSTYYSSTSASVPSAATALTLTGLGNLTGTGTASGQIITGNGGNDTLTGASRTSTIGGDTLIAGGGAGNDLLIAGANDGDVLYGGNGNDTLEAPSGTAPILYSGNPYGQGANATTFLVDTDNADIQAGPNDILKFGPDISLSDIVVSAYENSWYIRVNPSDPNRITISGTLGYIELSDGTLVPFSAFVSGSFTAGSIEYASSNTTLAGGLTSLTLDENTSLTGTGNNLNDTLNADSGYDTLIAGSGNDVLNANASGDVLDAGSGNDTLVSGSGSVTMNGNNPTGTGSGSATYVLSPNATSFTVNNAGPNDTLQIGAGIDLSDFQVQQTGTQFTFTFFEGQTAPVVVNGQVGNLKLADGTIIPFASYLSNGYFIDGSIEYANTNTTLQSGLTKMFVAGPGNTGTGNALNDTITTKASGDTLVAGSGNDTLNAQNSGDSLVAGSGNDTLIAGGANDTMVGGSGNDTLIAGATNDTMIGGRGNTTFVVSAAGFGSIPSGTILQSTNSEILFIENLPNVSVPTTTGIGAYQTDAQLFMYAINNGTVTTSTVQQSNGTIDTMIGNLAIQQGANGMLNQVIFADGSTATIDQMLAAGGNSVSSAANITMSATAIGVTLTGTGNLSATGNTLDDVMVANSGSDTLTAGSGNDLLEAGSGNDTLIAGSGNDTFQSGSGTTTIDNSTYADTLTRFASTLSQITASTTGSGSSTVVTLTSSLGGKVIVNGANLNVQLNNGTTTLNQILGVTPSTATSAVNATVPGGDTNLTLTGSANLTATGNSLNDVITGNSGNDTLIAGSGVAPTLIGGSGNDTFVLNTSINTQGYSNDVITEAPNTGSNTEVTTVSTVLAANVQNLTANGAILTINNADFGPLGTVDGSITAGLTLTGNNLANVITASVGQDTLVAGSGVATLIGGSGDDTFVVNNSADVVQASGTLSNIIGLPVVNGAPSNVEETSASITGAANVQKLVGTGTANLTLTGNSTTMQTIYSNGYNDTLVSGGNNDVLFGATSISSTGSTDVMVGSSNGPTTYSVTGENGFGYVTAPDYRAVITNSQSADTLDLTYGGNETASTFESDIAATSVTKNGVTDITLYTGGTCAIEIEGGALAQVSLEGETQTTISQLLAQNAEITSSTSYVLPASTGSSIGNLVLTGSANLTGTATSGNNIITANSGNDTLIGGANNDTLVGGTGNDTFVVSSNNDFIIEAANSGDNTEEASVSVTLAANVQNLTGTGSASLALFGNKLANVITANSGADELQGGTGLSTLVGGAGNDTLLGNANAATTYLVNSGDGAITIGNSASNDVLDFGAGITASSITATTTGTGSSTVVTLAIAGGNAVTIDAPAFTEVSFTGGTTTTLAALLASNPAITSAVSIVMPATATKLTLTGTANISGTGNSLADTIIANSGNDTLISGSGIDTLVGGAGNDTFVINNSSDAITETTAKSGNVVQSAVNYVLPANLLNLTGTGTASITLTGNASANTITANSGADTLVAGSGLATLVGGSGNDTFVVDNASDVVTKAANTGSNTEQTSVSVTLAANVQNLTGTGTANLTLTGGATADTITANSANDTLVAGTGVATLVGGTGNDTFVVNNASDVINKAANTGSNTEQTSVSTTIATNLQNLTGIGSAALTLTGGATADTITANTGADILIAGTGVATLVGGSGNDTFEINNASDVITKATNSGNNTEQSSVSITLAANVQNLTGTGTAAVILTGNSLTNTITANSGADTLVAGSGLATLVGGSGNDTFVIDNAGDVITKATNTGSNTEQTSVSATLAANVQNLTGTGTAAITLTGNTFANTITANSGADTLIAGSGVATLVGGSGNDTFVIDNASDVVTKAANTGSNTEQTSVSTTIAANLQNLTGTGSAALTLTGGATADTITANSGADTLLAGSGVATLVGGSGNDTFVIDNASDVITKAANTGSNTEQTSVSTTIAANLQNLTGTGSAALTLTGGATADTITANSGADTLVAGSGVATLVGGSGNDTFVVNNSSDAITVTTAKAGNVVQSNVNYVLPANLLNLTGTGTAAISLTGNASADTITANSGADTLIAGSGLATLVGGSGNDTFVIDNASDVITKAANTGSNTEQTSVSTTIAANLQNLTGTGAAALTLTGGATADTITANSGADTLVAGSGAATLVGGSGNDTFVVNNASDVITKAANTGSNTEQTSVSTTIAANLQNLTGTGSAALTLTGGATADTITANSGADTLVAGTGVATLVGGSGNDTFVVNNSSDAITVSAAKAGNLVQSTVNYVLPANLLSLTGTGTGSISLTGNTLADTITANSGADTLVSGTGIDTLVGGAGNDTFVVNNSSDAITVTTAKAGNVVQSNVNYVLPTNLLNLTGTGTAAISLTGNASADTITANSGADTLIAGSGLATLIGGSGNDTFVIDNASDVITKAANTGNNTEQTSVTATLAANVQNLTATGTTAVTLTGNTLNDVITANSAADKLVAGAGNDTLVSGTGIDTLTGGVGSDTFDVNNASDVVTATSGSNVNTISSTVSYTASTNVQDLFLTGTAAITGTGNSGNDLLIAGSGTDTLVGGSGTSVLEAGSGNDTLKDTAAANALIGGAGNDTMTGGTGADFIAGGAGNDAITLGAGTAVVAFNTGAGKATIAAGTGLSNVLSLGGGISYANLSFSKSGNNLILNTGGNNSITFTNWYAGTADQNFVTLQVIEQAASTYSSSSTNVLYNNEVEDFNFTKLVGAFNTALASTPTLTSWSLSNALLTDHLSGSNTAALGGDLAYYDGLHGNLTGMNLATAVSTLQNATYGKTAQTIDAWSGISTGSNRLH